MSNFMPTPPRVRPTVVTAAGYLLYAIAALLVIQIAITAATYSHQMDVVNEISASNSQLSNLKGVESAILIFTIVFYLLVAAVLAVCGVYVLRGRNGMRITAWVFAGLMALCGCFGVVGSGFSSSLTSNSSSGIDQAEVQKLKDAVPGWAHAALIAIAILMLISAILVIVLLALKASNAFFRKEQVQMVMPYPQYPVYPTYPDPNQPGQPGPPGQPGGWSNPGGEPPVQ